MPETRRLGVAEEEGNAFEGFAGGEQEFSRTVHHGLYMELVGTEYPTGQPILSPANLLNNFGLKAIMQKSIRQQMFKNISRWQKSGLSQKVS